MPSSRYPKCFLSISLDPADAAVVDWFRKLVEAVEFDTVTGEAPSPESLPEAITTRIQESHTFVAILTKRSKVEGRDEWKAPTWIEQEIAIAHSFGKPIAAFLEEGVSEDGLARYITKFQRWSRKDLAGVAAATVRYLVELRNKVTPPFDLQGDVGTMRALLLELSGVAPALESVKDSLEVPGWLFAYWTAVTSGRFLTLPPAVIASVGEAYGALDPVNKAVAEIREAKEKRRPKPVTWLDRDIDPPPLLPEGDPLWQVLQTARDDALVKVRRAGLILMKHGYPAEWPPALNVLKQALSAEEFRKTYGVDWDEL